MYGCIIFFGNKHARISLDSRGLTRDDLETSLQFTATQIANLHLIGLEPVVPDSASKTHLIPFYEKNTPVDDAIIDNNSTNNKLKSGNAYRLKAEDKRMSLLSTVDSKQLDGLKHKFSKMGGKSGSISPESVMSYYSQKAETYLTQCDQIFHDDLDPDLHLKVNDVIREYVASAIAQLLDQDIMNTGSISLDNFLCFILAQQSVGTAIQDLKIFAFDGNLLLSQDRIDFKESPASKKSLKDISPRNPEPARAILEKDKRIPTVTSDRNTRNSFALEPNPERFKEWSVPMSAMQQAQCLLHQDVTGTISDMKEAALQFQDSALFTSRQSGSIVERKMVDDNGTSGDRSVGHIDDDFDDQGDIHENGSNEAGDIDVALDPAPVFSTDLRRVSATAINAVDRIKYRFVLHTPHGPIIKAVKLDNDKQRIEISSGGILVKKKIMIPYWHITRYDDGALRDALCFSIVTSTRTYNLQTSTAKERDMWVNALKAILSINQS